MDKDTIDKIKSLTEEAERYEKALDRINNKNGDINVEYYLSGHGFTSFSICKNKKDKEELTNIVKDFINEKLEKIYKTIEKL